MNENCEGKQFQRNFSRIFGMTFHHLDSFGKKRLSAEDQRKRSDEA
jgi:hypothetical protein